MTPDDRRRARVDAAAVVADRRAGPPRAEGDNAVHARAHHEAVRTRLVPVTPVNEPARDAREEAVVALLEGIGEDPSRDGLRDTPRRVVKALAEMTVGYQHDPAQILGTVFDEDSDEMVVVRGIPFWSLCEHHMLPFHGAAHVAYLPDGQVVGLSKIPRLVECFARRLQVQERMTAQVADALATHLRPRGVAVLIEGEHTCMRIRGIQREGTMVTSAYRGALRDGPARSEFLQHLRPR